MLRKIIISLVLCATLLLVLSTLVSANGGGRELNQDTMATPTAVVPLNEDLPLADSQTGNCPMMGGTGMTGSAGMSGMNMGGMSGMQMGDMSGMQGQGMSGMAGMQGMSSMSGMSGMQGMSGMNGGMAFYAAPWYSNPWLMLGWVLLAVAVIGILAGIVFGIRWIRNSKPAQTVNAS